MGIRVTVGLVAPLVVAVSLLAACGEEGAPTAEEPPPGGEATSTPTDHEGPVAQAVADLARRTTVEPAEIEVVEVEAVTWDDGAIGCPQPGELYTQAQVAGHRIVLRADGRTWPYHSGGGRGPFLCENLQPSVPPDPGSSE